MPLIVSASRSRRRNKECQLIVVLSRHLEVLNLNIIEWIVFWGGFTLTHFPRISIDTFRNSVTVSFQWLNSGCLNCLTSGIQLSRKHFPSPSHFPCYSLSLSDVGQLEIVQLLVRVVIGDYITAEWGIHLR